MAGKKKGSTLSDNPSSKRSYKSYHKKKEREAETKRAKARARKAAQTRRQNDLTRAVIAAQNNRTSAINNLNKTIARACKAVAGGNKAVAEGNKAIADGNKALAAGNKAIATENNVMEKDAATLGFLVQDFGPTISASNGKSDDGRSDGELTDDEAKHTDDDEAVLTDDDDDAALTDDEKATLTDDKLSTGTELVATPKSTTVGVGNGSNFSIATPGGSSKQFAKLVTGTNQVSRKHQLADSLVWDDYHIPKKRKSAPTTPLANPGLVPLASILLGNRDSPDNLVGLCLKPFELSGCVELTEFDSLDHVVARLEKRAGTTDFGEIVESHLLKGTIELNPNPKKDNSKLAVKYVDDNGTLHFFPFDINPSGRMKVRTYIPHSPLRQKIYSARRHFMVGALEWLTGQLGVGSMEDAVAYVVDVLSTSNCCFELRIGSSASLTHVVVMDVIRMMWPSPHEVDILNKIPNASAMGDVEAWIIGVSSIPRARDKHDFVRVAAYNRYQLYLHPNQANQLDQEIDAVLGRLPFRRG